MKDELDKKQGDVRVESRAQPWVAVQARRDDLVQLEAGGPAKKRLRCLGCCLAAAREVKIFEGGRRVPEDFIGGYRNGETS